MQRYTIRKCDVYHWSDKNQMTGIDIQFRIISATCYTTSQGMGRNVCCVLHIELKRTGTLPEAGNLKPKFWGSGGITRPPCENRARPFAKYKQNPGRKLQEMS